jgi:PHD/YefM family antitoxin component YafN of YafNO toxin-antitoxin module
MKTIGISEARLRWREVATLALAGPVLITRYGRPWVIVIHVTARLGEILGNSTVARSREAGRELCRISAAVRDGAAVLVIAPHHSPGVAIMPAGEWRVSQHFHHSI